MYALAQKEGYSKSPDEFKALLNTNEKAFNTMYGLAQKEGYKKSVDDFKSLLGVGSVEGEPENFTNGSQEPQEQQSKPSDQSGVPFVDNTPEYLKAPEKNVKKQEQVKPKVSFADFEVEEVDTNKVDAAGIDINKYNPAVKKGEAQVGKSNLGGSFAEIPQSLQKGAIDKYVKDVFTSIPAKPSSVITKPKPIVKEAEVKKIAEVAKSIDNEEDYSMFSQALDYISQVSNSFSGEVGKAKTQGESAIKEVAKTITDYAYSAQDKASSAAEKSANLISDVAKYGGGWAKKILMEKTDLVSSDDAPTKTEEIITEAYVPEIAEEEIINFSDIFNEEKGYIGEVHKDANDKPVFSTKANGKIHHFENAFDNDEGYNYTPIPNKGNHVDKSYKSPGVAHFLLDADLSQGKPYMHEYSKGFIEKQLNGENILGGSTVKEQYFPVYKKTDDGKVNIKYKTKEELSEEDKKRIAAPLRQYRYTDLDWDAKGVKTNHFNNNVKAIPTKKSWDFTKYDGKVIKSNSSHLIYSEANGKGAYGDFSGTAVVFIINKGGKRLVVDYANSVQSIQNKGLSLINKYGISPDELIIGMHDLGSFNAKPVADEKGNLRYNPTSFNTKDETGGALAF